MIGRPSAVDTALAVSIALPPPSATSPSAPSTASMAAFTPQTSAWGRAPKNRCSMGSSRCRHRSVEISKARPIERSFRTSGKVSRPQRTITYRLSEAMGGALQAPV